jgi:hypothetical protein
VGKTFKALKRYYKKKSQSPAVASQDRSEKSRETLFVHDHNAGLQQEHNFSDPQPLAKAAKTRDVHSDTLGSIRTNDRKRGHYRPWGTFKRYKIEPPIAKKILRRLNQNAVRDIIAYKYFLNIRSFLKYINGEVFKSDEGTYYKIGFESRVMPTVLFDRKGDLVNFVVLRNPPSLRNHSTYAKHHLLDAAAISRLEQRLLDKFFIYIDLNVLKKIFNNIFELNLHGDISCEEANIVVFDNQVAYELIIGCTTSFSLIMDVQGNFIDTVASDGNFKWESLVTGLQYDKNLLPSLNLFKDPV